MKVLLIDWPIVVSMFVSLLGLYLRHRTMSAKGEGIMFVGCPAVLSVRPFVPSYIVTTISHERLKKPQ